MAETRGPRRRATPWPWRLSEAGRQKEACEILRQVLRIDPDNAKACEQMGLVELRLGHWPQARDLSRRGGRAQARSAPGLEQPRAWRSTSSASRERRSTPGSARWTRSRTSGTRSGTSASRPPSTAVPQQARAALRALRGRRAAERYGGTCGRRGRVLERLPVKGSASLLLASLAPRCACSRVPAASRSVPEGTPVVIISIDTLRADHLPAYGYRGVETPAIDAPARDGILFENAYSPTPLTFPAHSSLLTGVLPGRARRARQRGLPARRGQDQRGELPFLPQLLKERAMPPAARSRPTCSRARAGSTTGFDLYEDSVEFRTDPASAACSGRASETLTLSLDWLARRRRTSRSSSSSTSTSRTPPTRRRSRSPRATRPVRRRDRRRRRDRGRSPDRALEGLDVYDRALIVLLSDHGEGLGDHGEEEHGVLLYNEAIHVPLLVKLPGGQRSRIDRRQAGPAHGRRADRALAAGPARCRRPAGDVPAGRCAEAPERRIYSETFYPRLHFGWSELASLIDGTASLHRGAGPRAVRPGGGPGGEDERPARRAPGLRRDCARRCEGYDRRLAAAGRGGRGGAPGHDRSGLHRLGRRRDLSGPLPDPKSRIGVPGRSQGRVPAQRRARSTAGRGGLPPGARGQSADGGRLGVPRRARLKTWGRTDEAAGRLPGGAADLGRLAVDRGLRGLALLRPRPARRGRLARQHGRADPSLLRPRPARPDRAAARRTSTRRRARPGWPWTTRAMRLGPMITLAEVLHAQQDYDGGAGDHRQAADVYAQREAKDPDLIRGLSLIRGKILADLGDAAGGRGRLPPGDPALPRGRPRLLEPGRPLRPERPPGRGGPDAAADGRGEPHARPPTPRRSRPCAR